MVHSEPFEIEPFNTATMKASKAAAAFTLSGSLITVAGGGDTVAALNQAGVVDEFSYGFYSRRRVS